MSYASLLRYLSLTTLIPTTPEGGAGMLPQDDVSLIMNRDFMAVARTPLEHSPQLLHRMVSSFGHRYLDASSAETESRRVSMFSNLFLTTYDVLCVNVFILPLLISRLTRVELVHRRHSIRSSSDMVMSSKWRVRSPQDDFERILTQDGFCHRGRIYPRFSRFVSYPTS